MLKLEYEWNISFLKYIIIRVMFIYRGEDVPIINDYNSRQIRVNYIINYNIPA